jgi:NADPH-dependent 2,4-dienoyl-CoA reductase/sulfur reductase-like enzyme
LRLETELKEIVDDGMGRAKAVITKEGEAIECGFVGLTVGVSPNIDFLEGSGIETQKGVVVNEFLETSVEDVYAIGDCAQLQNPMPGRRPVEAIWYTGRMAGETVAYNICGKKVAYDPGIWFNSAKFLDIEYQVYGTVLANPPENHSAIYWEHSSGKKSIRIVYDKDTLEILGFNLMGVRYRHEVCEKWIKEKASVEEVLKNLTLANFDPEFFDEYEEEVISIYNSQERMSLQKSKKRSWNTVLNFLKN